MNRIHSEVHELRGKIFRFFTSSMLYVRCKFYLFFFFATVVYESFSFKQLLGFLLKWLFLGIIKDFLNCWIVELIF